MLNVLIGVCLAYVISLFAVAFWAERASMRGRANWLRSPMIYTLSLSIYCTGWTFYGAVGYAARSGLEFVTIYLGPSLVMLGWWWILRKLVRIGRAQRVTSIADLISSRFGKSNGLGVLVTILAIVGTTPYIALQLQSVTLSFSAFANSESLSDNTAALWLGAGLALFTILFGTRNLDVNERHHGVVMAIAVEAVVKLCALVAVGVFVVWGVLGGIGPVLSEIDASKVATWDVNGNRWIALTFLSGAAFLCLPRMFQVLVVENADEGHLHTASWAFPTYLMLMSLFVIPIAVAGLKILPIGSNPDLFVLSLPLSLEQDALAMFAFIGGFSSATSMVIVASLALATMVSNHIVMPIWIKWSEHRVREFGDVRRIILISRRFAILLIILLGYIYYWISGGGAALAAIGLVSFAGVTQVLPAMLGGIFWRGANRIGATAGLLVGFSIWLYTLFLPSLGNVYSAAFLAEGPWGIWWLRPQALFGVTELDPLVHALFWSISLNALTFFVGSLISFPTPIERLQGAQIVNVYDHSPTQRGWSGRAAQSEDLMIMAQRILGVKQARALFQAEVQNQGGQGYLPDPTPEFLRTLERELAGSVGAATAHAMIGQTVGGTSVSVQDLMAVADEAAQIMEYSNRLEEQSRELTRTAQELQSANEKLTQISIQKDAFLSQVSHELRTPMTSILSFAQILRDGASLKGQEQSRYASIIHDESVRLTRLLDDLLDLSVLENGQVNLNIATGRVQDLINRSIATVIAGDAAMQMQIDCKIPDDLHSLTTDLDRLGQVFINLISNAKKYCDAASPKLQISAHQSGSDVIIDFVDNGIGIPAQDRDFIFEKFARVGEQKTGGAGLGLAICKEIIARLGGEITYLSGHRGAAFRVQVPVNFHAA
ncbi:MAG: sodium:solute symporter [Rhodobacteraceae bacterium]|nr:sodium:solute symporter [Paracoccaceae bacterium]